MHRHRSIRRALRGAFVAAVLVAGPAAAASRPAPPPPSATITWTGNGTSVVEETRGLNDPRCDEESTPYLLWILSGSKATSASIALPDGSVNMGKPNLDKKGWSTFKKLWTPGSAIDLDTLLAAPVVATYNDAKNKATLTVSHGCTGASTGDPGTVEIWFRYEVYNSASQNLSSPAVVNFCEHGNASNCVTFTGGATNGIAEDYVDIDVSSTPATFDVSGNYCRILVLADPTGGTTASTDLSYLSGQALDSSSGSFTTTSTWNDGDVLYWFHAINC